MLPPAESFSPPARPPADGEDGGAEKPIVLPGAMQDRRIITKTLGGGDGPTAMNPLAAASASRLLDDARGANLPAVPGQDPRIRTQSFAPTAVAGQDYRVQTHAFPQGLLEGKGISLREGGHSAQTENDSLMRAIQENAGGRRGGAAPNDERGPGGLPVLQEGVEMHAAHAGGAGGSPPMPTVSASGGTDDDWDSASASESMTGSELSQTISDSAHSSLTSSSQAVSSVSDTMRTNGSGNIASNGGGSGGTGVGAGVPGVSTAGQKVGKDNTKQRNREAAKDYRRRKKEYMKQLQADVERLQHEKVSRISCATIRIIAVLGCHIQISSCGRSETARSDLCVCLGDQAQLANQCNSLQSENTMLRGLVSAPPLDQPQHAPAQQQPSSMDHGGGGGGAQAPMAMAPSIGLPPGAQSGMGLAQHHQITQQQQQLYQQQQQQQLYQQQQQQQQQRQQLYEQQQRAQQQAEAQAQQQAEARYQSQYHDQQQSLAVPAPSLPAPPAIIDTDTIIGGGDSRGGGALSMDVGEVEYPPVANPLEEDDDDAYAALEDMLEGPSDAAVRADDL